MKNKKLKLNIVFLIIFMVVCVGGNKYVGAQEITATTTSDFDFDQALEKYKLEAEKYMNEFGATPSVSTQDFYIESLPKAPEPNSKVDINLISYSFDINRSNIVWKINNSTKLSGTGQKSFSFNVGDAGSKTTLSVFVTTPDGTPLSKTLVYQPADVDILWEADTYVPYDYRGKAMPSSDAKIKVTAVPNLISGGSKISASRLIYNWQINYKNMPAISGYGKQSFSYDGPKIYNTDTIKVTVTNYSGEIKAEKMVKINIIMPKILFYKDSPLEGLAHNISLFGKNIFLNEGTDIVAEPFFFSNKDIDVIKYDWFADKKTKFFRGAMANKIRLEIEDVEEKKESTISVRANNESNILQFSSAEIKIKYDNE